MQSPKKTMSTPIIASNHNAATGSTGQKVSTALRKVRGNIERLFEKSLSDMIRGIRNNKDNEAKYVMQCMDEIKQELKQDNIVLKANAIAKLTYLQMLGYDITWGAFNIIEVMSSTKFTFKRIGYLAASQSFNENTEVIMLTTNLIRKDLNSPVMYESGIALGGLSCFVTCDLARDLANDVVTLLTSSKPYIRKRAVLLLYKVFLRYPDALRPTFTRLKEKLEDPDQGVQSAAVNVICELARKNPKNYLSLAPVFFKLMTSSTNNWMLIKIIKLFGALTPFEPRLGKKLIEPLTNLINSTSAMSLLYECINTVIAVLISISSEAPGNHTSSIQVAFDVTVQLCVQKLSALIEDTDQNLKYLGLLAMGKILQTHPKAVQVHKDLILACLDDKDESIRLRALDLLYGMVSRKNIMEIVKRLLQHVEKAEGSLYRDELLAKIVQICSHNNYQHITNFEWYVSVLVELTKVEGTKHGVLIADQMLDVAVRVPSIRHFAVSQMALLIENAHLLLSCNIQHRSNMCEVLNAAAWICGEYSEHIRNPQIVLESLLRTKLNIMPGHIQSVFVQNIAKIYARMLHEAENEDDWDKVYSLDNLMLSKMPVFEQTDCLEAQERACSVMQLTQEVEKFHKNNEKVADDFMILFEGELGPVAAKAQRKVPAPGDLDLNAWINEPLPESSSESEREETPFAPDRPATLNMFGPKMVNHNAEPRKTSEPTEQELQQVREARKAEVESNPHYLKMTSSSSVSKNISGGGSHRSSIGHRNSSFEGKLPEITPIELQSPLDIPGMVGLTKYIEQQQKTISWKNAKKEKRKSGASKSSKSSKKSSKKQEKKHSSSEEDENVIVHSVNRGAGEMPEGAKSTDEDEPSPESDLFKALNINLDEPLRPDERLPVLHHRITPPVETPPLPKSSSNGFIKVGADKKQVKKKKKSTPKETEIKMDDEKPAKEKKKKKTGTETHSKTLVDLNETKKIDEKLSKKHAENFDLWLEDSEKTGKFVNEPNMALVEAESGPIHIKKKKGSKKEGKSISLSKKSDREKRPSGGAGADGPSGGLLVDTRTLETQSPVIDRNEYEEASGFCTPSQQEPMLSNNNNGSGSSSSLAPFGAGGGGDSARHSPVHAPPGAAQSTKLALQELSNFTTLAKNSHLKLTYEVKTSLSDSDTFTVKVVFANLTEYEISKLEFCVLDSLSLKLIKSDEHDENVHLPFSLPPHSSNEQEFAYSVLQTINAPQKLRGNLTYMLKTKDGMLSEKLDFQMIIRCINLTAPATISNDSFTDLLSSGDLCAKNSINFECPDLSFEILLTKICYAARFSIVELTGNSASLYCQTIQSHPICVLVKQDDHVIRVDGKCTDSQLLSHILQEIKELFIVQP